MTNAIRSRIFFFEYVGSKKQEADEKIRNGKENGGELR